MAYKNFGTDIEGYEIYSDSNDIRVNIEDPAMVFAIKDWCSSNKVDALLMLLVIPSLSIWRIKDEQQRAWFMLRWGSDEHIVE